MKNFLDYLAETEKKNGPFIVENASAGSTCAANIATANTAIGGLGVGFDPDGDHGIYPNPKKKAKKPTEKVTVLRRAPY